MLHLCYTAIKESNDSGLGWEQSDWVFDALILSDIQGDSRHWLGLRLGHSWSKYQCRTFVLSVIFPSGINNFVPQQNQCPNERLHGTSLMRVFCSLWSGTAICFNFSLLSNDRHPLFSFYCSYWQQGRFFWFALQQPGECILDCHRSAKIWKT